MKENQKLHFGKQELLDDNATLADLNILPGAQLWVMDTGQHENRDIAGMANSSCQIMENYVYHQQELICEP